MWTRKTGYITDRVNQSTWITTEALGCFSGMRLSFCFFYICSIPELCIVLSNGQERLNAVGIWGPNECVLCHFQLTQDRWWEIKSESQNLCWRRERAPEGFFPPLFVAVGYVSLFYGCSNFKCIFLSCEMQSFNFPGRELEGLIDVCTHLTIRHIVI